jgi:hypothetical protein
VGRLGEHGPPEARCTGIMSKEAGLTGHAYLAGDTPVPLMPAIAIPLRQPVADQAPPAAMLAPMRATDQPLALAQAIERLRQSDERYRGVRPEVSGGIVHLRGTVANPQDLFALAKAIAQLPGVQRVILEEVRTERFRR